MSADVARIRAVRRALRVIALAPVVLAPHLIGGATAELSTAIACAFALSGVATLFAFPEADLPVGTKTVVVLCLVLLAWTGLQASPLGCDLVASLTHPDRTLEARTVARLLGVSPYCSTSVDPGLTWRALMMGAACTLAFVSSALFCASGHRMSVVTAVAMSGASIAASAVLHTAYDAARVYGLYTPIEGGATHGPLINVNHLAGFCALTMPCMIAVAISTSDRGARATWLAAAAGSVLVALATLSRGGMGAMFVAIVLVGLATAARQRREKAMLGPSAALAATAAGAWFVLGGPILREYLEDETGKLDMIRIGARHALDQGVMGHGRGAFGVAAVDVYTQGEWVRYAESFPVQWLGDYGLVVGALAIVGFSVPVLRALRAAHHTTRRLAAIGLIAFGLQNLVDFGLELSGIAVVAASALGVAASSGRATRPDETTRVFRGRLATVFAALIVVALAVTGATSSADATLADVREDLEARDFDEVDRSLARALRMHPRDPGLSLYAAAAARARDEDVTVAWLNHTMRIAPTWWSPHQEAALFFAQRGRWLQATHEIKAVADRSVIQGRDLVCRLAGAGLPLRYLPRAAPARAPGPFLAMVSHCLPTEQSIALDAMLLTWRVPPEHALERGITRALSANDPETALRLTTMGQRLYPRSAALALANARRLTSLSRPADAERAITRASRLGATTRDVAMARATLYAANRDVPKMRTALTAIRDLAEGEPEALAAAEAYAATLERQVGNATDAIEALERAHMLDGRASHLAGIYEIARAEGWRARAEIARRQMCGLEPTHPACAER